MPLDAFAGDNIPWIVTIKMAAVNSNGVRGPVTSAGPVTVGPVTAPRSTGAMAFDNDGTNRVSVLYTPGDTTGIADRCSSARAGTGLIGRNESCCRLGVSLCRLTLLSPHNPPLPAQVPHQGVPREQPHGCAHLQRRHRHLDS